MHTVKQLVCKCMIGSKVMAMNSSWTCLLVKLAEGGSVTNGAPLCFMVAIIGLLWHTDIRKSIFCQTYILTVVDMLGAYWAGFMGLQGGFYGYHCTVWKTIKEVEFRICNAFIWSFKFSLSFLSSLMVNPLIIQNTFWSDKILVSLSNIL